MDQALDMFRAKHQPMMRSLVERVIPMSGNHLTISHLDLYMLDEMILLWKEFDKPACIKLVEEETARLEAREERYKSFFVRLLDLVIGKPTYDHDEVQEACRRALELMLAGHTVVEHTRVVREKISAYLDDQTGAVPYPTLESLSSVMGEYQVSKLCSMNRTYVDISREGMAMTGRVEIADVYLASQAGRPFRIATVDPTYFMFKKMAELRLSRNYPLQWDKDNPPMSLEEVIGKPNVVIDDDVRLIYVKDVGNFSEQHLKDAMLKHYRHISMQIMMRTLSVQGD